jgi:hypothetical protein
MVSYAKTAKGAESALCIFAERAVLGFWRANFV